MRANLRKAELGFLGVIVPTSIATPLLNGEPRKTGRFSILLKLYDKAGDFVFALAFFLGLFSYWLNVGMRFCLRAKRLGNKFSTPTNFAGVNKYNLYQGRKTS